MNLNSTGAGNEARAYQTFSYPGVSTYTVTLDVFTNTITYRVGTSLGGSQITTGTLTAGTGKTFNFTPTTNSATIYVEFQSTASAAIDNVVLSTPEYIIDMSYTTAEVEDLQFAQSFDTLFIASGTQPVAKLVRYDHDRWVLSDVSFDEPAYLDQNDDESVTLTPSGTTGSITVTASSATFASTDVGRAIRYKAGPDKENAVTYTGTGTQVNFDIPFYPQGSSDIQVYKVAATGVRTLQTNPANYTVSSGQVVMGSAPSTSEKIVIEEKNSGSGEWGWMTITAYSTSTSVTATVGRELAGTNASAEWQLGAWSDTTGYPKSVCFHEQRLWFGNTSNQPQTFWASEIGNYTNFQPDNYLYKGDVDDATGFSFTLGANKSQAITWIASKGSCLIGTVNGVYSIRGSNNTSISAKNISAKKETDVNCANILYTETANEVIFVERIGKKVYSLGYSFEIDGYMATDLTLLAEHLGNDSSIVEIVYQEIPDKILWARRSDGSLISCTYIKSQEVNGWARHELGGTNAVVRSIITIPGDDRTELWIHTSRTINASTVRYIELLNAVFFGGEKEDAKFLDCMGTYDSTATTTVTGLSWLEGETVSILADGSVRPDVTVSGGSITLTRSASVVQVGFNYNSDMRTLSLEGGSVIGTSQSALSRVSKYAVRFYETLGGKIGHDGTDLDIIYFRAPTDVMGASSPLYSGFKKGAFPKGFEDEYTIFVRQYQPLPMTILGIVSTVSVEDN
jgi:hypothetical protein